MQSVLNASGLDAAIAPQEGKGIMALQGPKAVNVMERLTGDVNFAEFKFMTGRNLPVNGVDCYVTRSGYTGEDGFEISCEGCDAEALAEVLLAQEEVKPVGLGARDSLRLEAGLCLYGNDIDDSTTPLEAGLLWTINKRRRSEGGFVGSDLLRWWPVYRSIFPVLRTHRFGLFPRQHCGGPPVVRTLRRRAGHRERFVLRSFSRTNGERAWRGGAYR